MRYKPVPHKRSFLPDLFSRKEKRSGRRRLDTPPMSAKAKLTQTDVFCQSGLFYRSINRTVVSA